MKPILREEYRALIRRLGVPKTVEELASELSWDRLHILLMLNELIKTGLAERTDTELYGLTKEGIRVLEGLEVEARLAELPAAFPSERAWPSVYERVPFGKRHSPRIIKPEDWIKEWKKKWSWS